MLNQERKDRHGSYTLGINKAMHALYVPGRTGCSLNLQTVSSLKDHKTFGRLRKLVPPVDFEKYVKTSSPKKVYSGDDAMLTEYTPLGCEGLVSVASNWLPKQTHLYTNPSISNELLDDHQWQKWSIIYFLLLTLFL